MNKARPLSSQNVQPEQCALLVPVFEDEERPAGPPPDGFLTASLRQMLQELKDGDVFGGEKEDVYAVVPAGEEVRQVVFFGLGSRQDVTHERLRRAIGRGIREVTLESVRRTITALPDPADTPLSTYETGRAYQEGVLLAEYEFDEYRSGEQEDRSTEHLFVYSDSGDDRFAEGLAEGRIYAEGTCHARDLANEPPSRMNPDDLVKEARSLEGNRISVDVLREDQLEEKGMEPTLGVSAGSNVEPAQILMTYRPVDSAADDDVHVGLAGKGITFDSGGLNLKPLKSMMDMKFDMCGAAAVLGVFHVIDELEPGIPVTGICGCSENMTGPDAQKMRDVVRSYGGTSIEITHTDAEGRLVLSDALAYLEEQGVTEMIDLATLTGSVVTALGSEYAGLMSPDEDLAGRLGSAVERAGEQVWELPLADEYESHLESPVADVRNTGTKGEAGAIIAGLFLRNFVEDCPWAHLDIAGTAWKGDGSDYRPEGGVGFGVRTLLEYIQDRAGER